MLKVLRKYKGPLIAVGGSLLMLAFLAPELIRQAQGDPRKRTVAKLAGTNVSMAQEIEAEQEFKAFEVFYPPLTTDLLGAANGQHWFLLAKEAERNGLVGEAVNGTEWLPELGALIADQEVRNRLRRGDMSAIEFLQNPSKQQELAATVTQNLLALRGRAAGQAQLSLQQMDKALAKARGVMRLRTSFFTAARLSEPGAIAAAREGLDGVTLDALVVPASRALAPAAAPTEEELLAHFEQYKAVRPGTGTFGFGYLQPPRFKLEWLKLDRAAIASAVRPDPVAVSKRYQTQRDVYKGEFSAERVNVENAVREEMVTQIMADADRVIRAEVTRALRKLEADGVYRKLPADWESQRPKFEAIANSVAESVQASHKITMPLPVVTIKANEWLDAAAVAALPDLGAATARLGSQSAPVAQFLLGAREITGANPLGIQAGVPIMEANISDFAQNRYYVMILEARPEAPPLSLDEVRVAVTRDLTSQKAYQLLLGEMNTQQALAATAGLQSVADMYNAQASESDRLSIRAAVRVDGGSPLPADLDTPEFREAVLKAANKLDPRQPAANQDPLARTIVVGLPTKQSAVVANIVEFRPLTRELFAQQGESQGRASLNRELGEIFRERQGEVVDPFSFDAIRARLSYVRLGADGKESPAPGKAAPSPSPAPAAPKG